MRRNDAEAAGTLDVPTRIRDPRASDVGSRSPQVSVSPVPAVKSQAMPQDHAGPRVRFVALTVGSVGVVYGDIGTSPLYAFREALVAAAGAGLPTPAIVLGVLSLIFWSLIL